MSGPKQFAIYITVVVVIAVSLIAYKLSSSKTQTAGATPSVDDATFQSQVLDFSGLAVVDMYADWCPPCRELSPIIQEVHAAYRGSSLVRVFKIDVDKSPQTAMKYGVQSIPTLLFIKNGELVATKVGLLPKAEILKLIDAHK